MTTEDAIRHFGGRRELAEALGIWVTATYSWGRYPPLGRQYQLQVLTDSKLKVEPNANDHK